MKFAAFAIISTVTDPERGEQERKLVKKDRNTQEEMCTQSSCSIGGLDEEISNSTPSIDAPQLTIPEIQESQASESNPLDQRKNRSRERNNSAMRSKQINGGGIKHAGFT